MKKFLMIELFIVYGCACLDYDQSDANRKKEEETEPKPKINFRIVNHTQNTYTKNALYSLRSSYKYDDKKRKTDTSKSYLIYYNDNSNHRIITHIMPNSTVENSENGDKKLWLSPIFFGIYYWQVKNEDYGYVHSGNFILMLSLNNGKQKIFFGEHDYNHERVGKTDENNCTYEFIKWVAHPVWQNKNVDIHIHEDRVEIDNLKKVSKIKIGGKELDININNIPIVEVK